MWSPFNPSNDALFLDIDGTILDIAPKAQDVDVPPELIESLKVLKKKLSGALALISGRMIHEIDALFAPLQLTCSGVHGAEWRLSPNGPIKTGAPLPHQLRDNIAEVFQDMEGVIVEDKIYDVSVHFRLAPEKGPMIEEKFRSLLGAYEKDVSFLPGRKVFEVTRTQHDKSEALKKLLSSPCFQNRRPVFLGDDITDLPAINFCLSCGGAAARVGQSPFESPAKVRLWLQQIAEAA